MVEKAWRYWEAEDGVGYILRFINQGEGCSLRMFGADKYRFREPVQRGSGDFQRSFATYFETGTMLFMEQPVNIEKCCERGRLSDEVIDELAPQIQRFRLEKNKQ